MRYVSRVKWSNPGKGAAPYSARWNIWIHTLPKVICKKWNLAASSRISTRLFETIPLVPSLNVFLRVVSKARWWSFHDFPCLTKFSDFNSILYKDSSKFSLQAFFHDHWSFSTMSTRVVRKALSKELEKKTIFVFIVPWDKLESYHEKKVRLYSSFSLKLWTFWTTLV